MYTGESSELYPESDALCELVLLNSSMLAFVALTGNLGCARRPDLPLGRSTGLRDRNDENQRAETVIRKYDDKK
jgi:hypothetical protein